MTAVIEGIIIIACAFVVVYIITKALEMFDDN
jgi:hypothetical protein